MSIPVVHQAAPNTRAAAENRTAFDALGITCVHLLGGTGCGKTAIIRALLPRLTAELNVGVVVADLATTYDAQRIEPLGVPVVQVLTDGQCHLAANQLQKGIAELPLASLDLVLVENVGGVICPARAALGEHVRMALASIAAGPQVIGKYPLLFRDAQVVLLTKYDLMPHTDFELDAAVHALHRLNPAAEVICTDTRRRVGIDRAAGWVLGYVRAQRNQRRGRSRSRLAAQLATTS